MRPRIPEKRLLWAVTILPVVAVHGSYLISWGQGFVPGCLPYWEGCTSISATGRQGFAYVFFKVLMLPQAMLLLTLWLLLARQTSPSVGKILRCSGMLGAVFLVLYVVFLGSEGDVYRLLRRYGVFVFFLGTWIAQITATVHWWRSRDRARSLDRWLRVQLVVLPLMFAYAVAEVPLGTFGVGDNRAENVIEWGFALLMQVWFATLLGRRNCSAKSV